MRKVIFYFLALFIMFVTLFIGTVDLDIANILQGDSFEQKIFLEIRLPRLVLAFLAGSVLALGGLVYQNIFRNALLSPYTLGISSGAVFGAGIAVKLGLVFTFLGISMINIFGFFGAFGTIVIILSIARFLRHLGSMMLLLLGIALSFFYSAALMLLFYLGSTLQNDMLLRFSMGSLSVVGWSESIAVSVGALLFFAVVWLYRYELTFLSISETLAQHKGVEVQRVLFVVLAVSALSIGVLVSITGPIGFIGLVVPHIVAKLQPVVLHRRLLATTFFGGFFLVLCDALSRLLQSQSELPVGIVTAFIGAPFLIYLIFRSSK